MFEVIVLARAIAGDHVVSVLLQHLRFLDQLRPHPVLLLHLQQKHEKQNKSLNLSCFYISLMLHIGLFDNRKHNIAINSTIPYTLCVLCMLQFDFSFTMKDYQTATGGSTAWKLSILALERVVDFLVILRVS